MSRTVTKREGGGSSSSGVAPHRVVCATLEEATRLVRALPRREWDADAPVHATERAAAARLIKAIEDAVPRTRYACLSWDANRDTTLDPFVRSVWFPVDGNTDAINELSESIAHCDKCAATDGDAVDIYTCDKRVVEERVAWAEVAISHRLDENNPVVVLDELPSIRTPDAAVLKRGSNKCCIRCKLLAGPPERPADALFERAGAERATKRAKTATTVDATMSERGARVRAAYERAY